MDMKAMMAEQKEEMLRDKYIESEKAGRDLGEPRMVQWTKEHAIAFRREYYRNHLMEIGNGEIPQYFAVFLDEHSRKELIDVLFDGVPNGWKVYAKMAVVARGDVYQKPAAVDFLAENLGKTGEFEVCSLGVSVEAIAVGVNGLFKTEEPIYIILAVASEVDVDPSQEFNFKTWKPFHITTPLKGVVDAFPSHFGWKH